jgi:hypothetical protein
MKFDFEDLGITALIKDQGKRSTKIYFGYSASNPYAEIAKSLAFGYDGELSYTSPRGNLITLKEGYPARPFLTDGVNYAIPLLNDEIEDYWKDFVERGVSSTDKLGQLIIDSIKEWVYHDPYSTGSYGASSLPNSEQVINDKGDDSIPLIDSGGMIDAMEFLVTKAINKDANIKRK